MNKSFNDTVKINIEQELDRRFIVIELLKPEDTLIYDYQINMISNNPTSAIIPIEARRKDEKASLYYDITLMVKLSDYLENVGLTGRELIWLVDRLNTVLIKSRSLLLDEKNFVLDVEYIYVEPEKKDLRLIYLPMDVSRWTNFSFKGFVVELITKHARLPRKFEFMDNSLDRVLAYAGSEGFNLNDFSKILGSVKCEYMNVSSAVPETRIGQSLQFTAGNAVLRQEAQKNGIIGASIIKTPVGSFDAKTLITALLLQIGVFIAAVALEIPLKEWGVEPDVRYAVIGMMVLIADLLIYKRLSCRRQKLQERHFFKRREAEKRP